LTFDNIYCYGRYRLRKTLELPFPEGIPKFISLSDLSKNSKSTRNLGGMFYSPYEKQPRALRPSINKDIKLEAQVDDMTWIGRKGKEKQRMYLRVTSNDAVEEDFNTVAE